MFGKYSDELYPFHHHLKTAAGSTLLILLRVNEAPLSEIKPITENIPNRTIGVNEKISPDFATPILKPSRSTTPIEKPTIEKSNACVRINWLIYLLPAPIALRVP
jgi:hypothetical protein